MTTDNTNPVPLGNPYDNNDPNYAEVQRQLAKGRIDAAKAELDRIAAEVIAEFQERTTVALPSE